MGVRFAANKPIGRWQTKGAAPSFELGKIHTAEIGHRV